MIVNSKYPPPGTEVGCEYRWPYDHAHPDCWGKPHKGIVLALDDPRAWTGSLRFPNGEPSQEECTRHVQKCLDTIGPFDNVPVLWTWGGAHEPKQGIQWDSKLRLYPEELAAWHIARAAKIKEYNQRQQQEIKQ